MIKFSKEKVLLLEMNGIKILCSDAELIHVGLSVADGSMGYEALLQWVIEHRE